MTSRPASMRQVLDTLAALAPDRQPTQQLHVPPDDLVALPLKFTKVLNGQLSFGYDEGQSLGVGPRLQLVEHILKRAQLHREEQLLRLGWLWVRTADERGQLVQFPLVSIPVRASRALDLLDTVLKGADTSARTASLIAAGEIELTDAITDPESRRSLEATLLFGGGAFDGEQAAWVSQAWLDRLPALKRWAADAARAAGIEDARVLARATPDDVAPFWKTPQVIVQLALYVTAPSPRSATIAATLRSWPSNHLDATAFAALYGASERSPEVTASDTVVHSPIVLTPAQRAAVASTRTEPVTVIAGPPGSGKTQTIAAIALDAIEHGRSVLVAAPSTAAVDAMVEILARTPGPEPIVFGADERRAELATRLTIGGGQLAGAAQVDRARQLYDAARRDHDALLRSVTELLFAERLAGDADAALLFHHRSVAPRWFEPAAALAEAAVLLDGCRRQLRFLHELRVRGRTRRLLRHAGSTSVDLEQLDAALRSAGALRASNDLQAGGGLDLDALWPRLTATDEAVRAAKAAWLDVSMRSERRITGKARSTMGLVAAALRAGRVTRRDKLGEIDGEHLTSALPLWAGTLRDIDDLLPRTAAMFDVVIIDEATQVDQITAAPALLRAARCVVAGDPKQLRHVSFVSDDAVAEALAANHVDRADDAGRLDIRRVSLFDLAASAAPTRVLDQHFRSAPHLISFSARRFYDDKVTIATTHPRNAARDCISVDRVVGRRGDDGVNRDEVDRVLAIVRDRQAVARAAGAGASIGVLSPFRQQADAIEAAIVEQFSLEEIDDLDLRVGTVHGFQGCERDLVVMSLALDPSSSPNSRSFVADANLFNVMVTRAREEIVVVTSLPLDTPGLLGEYLRHGDAPPAPPRSTRSPRRDVTVLAADLTAQGVAVAVGYPSGPHTVDLVLGEGEDALGVLFGVHPDGPDSHVERHLQLGRAGWQLREVFDTKWADRQAELAIELAFGRTP